MQTGEKNKKDTLIYQTYGRIIDMIDGGELKPSEFISHRFLANELKVSKQPVGIALQRLENDGVVESVPRVGTRVCQVTAEDMWGALQWRISLEVRIANLACEYGTDSDFEQLAELAKNLDDSILGKNLPLEKTRQQDMEFHLALAQAAKCRKMLQELSKLNIFNLKTNLCEAVKITRSTTPPETFVSHAKIVAAIRERDRLLASQLMEQHLEESGDMSKFVQWYRQNGLKQ